MDYGKLISSHYLNKEVSTLGKRFNYQQTDEYKPDKRYKMPMKLRKEVMKRDGHSCTKCGSADNLHVHHVEYRCAGGSEDTSNLTTLCIYCHSEAHKGTLGHNIVRLHSMDQANDG